MPRPSRTHFLAPLLDHPHTRWSIVNPRTGLAVATHLEPAFASESRRRGLLGRNHLAPDTALLLAPCSSVHTFFMRFPIDLLFVDRQGNVLKVSESLRPWRISVGWRGFAVIECAAGTITRSGTLPGDRLLLSLEPESV